MDLSFPRIDETLELKAILNRSRWDGILTKPESLLCRKYRIPLAYDCAQIGWVVDNDNCYEDDILYSKRPAAVAKNTVNVEKQLIDEFSISLQQLSSTKGATFDQYFELINSTISRKSSLNDVKTLDRFYFLLLNEIQQTFQYKLPEITQPFFISYRPWQTADVPFYAKMMGNPKLWEYLPEEYPSPFTQELAKNLIEVANIGGTDSTQAIVVNGEIAGQIRLLINNDYHGLKIAEVVYMLEESFWGKGLMSNILVNFLANSFDKYDFDFIYAWIRPDNLASIKCAERAGLIRDGFQQQEELANLSKRPGFSRYVCFKPNS